MGKDAIDPCFITIGWDKNHSFQLLLVSAKSVIFQPKVPSEWMRKGHTQKSVAVFLEIYWEFSHNKVMEDKFKNWLSLLCLELCKLSMVNTDVLMLPQDSRNILKRFQKLLQYNTSPCHGTFWDQTDKTLTQAQKTPLFKKNLFAQIKLQRDNWNRHPSQWMAFTAYVLHYN